MDYTIAAHMLMYLDVKSVQLLTNNPRKIYGLRRNGVTVVQRIPYMMQPKDENRFYLMKRMRTDSIL